ncbi:hypothetical protein HJG60_009898 [Phyllostomus discolor]|uniref:Uncharacterized protein n=1 Tax=Phyllostomus discolor TaxID=89673 RepID=A0A834B2U8_9CHIR|nr:hypothetical protein HJG60_009898 [Phyllostomus discolor]
MKCSHYHHQLQSNTSEFHFLFLIFNFIAPFSTMRNLAFPIFNLLTHLISLSAHNQSLSPQRSPATPCGCPSPHSPLRHPGQATAPWGCLPRPCQSPVQRVRVLIFTQSVLISFFMVFCFHPLLLFFGLVSLN